MGERGPLRDPESRRGQAEGMSVVALTDTRPPEPPRYLTAREKRIFRDLVEEAQKAALTPVLIDAHLYAKIARMELMLEKQNDPNVFLRIMRTQLACYQAAGMTEVGRRRLGIRPQQKKQSRIASILDAKQQLSG